MMDLKEIIKWFFPGFSDLLRNLGKMDWRLTFVCLFLLFNLCYAAEKENSVSEPNRTFLVGAKSFSFNLNSSDVVDNATNSQNVSKNNHQRSLEEIETGRTFGRPFKKMIAGLLPVIFSMGAASTWAMVATLVGIKTFFVTLLILKILLVAGAAKCSARSTTTTPSLIIIRNGLLILRRRSTYISTMVIMILMATLKFMRDTLHRLGPGKEYHLQYQPLWRRKALT
ncbi:hypothetical protein JYU34_001249 [Plutella xylostella]|uniref:Uncharacterized protein n=1 Tax=Plutella xylostella TaxID=51655 RepID=A0ABQ7R6D2_PLUXY|nr:hypothetical protein JYU34_001249 [Plutella xylostella]